MIKKKKILESEDIPEFMESIETMDGSSRIFIDKSLEIATHILKVMERKNLNQKHLSDAVGIPEAEVVKLLTGTPNYDLRILSKIEAALKGNIICIPGN